MYYIVKQSFVRVCSLSPEKKRSEHVAESDIVTSRPDESLWIAEIQSDGQLKEQTKLGKLN